MFSNVLQLHMILTEFVLARLRLAEVAKVRHCLTFIYTDV